MLKVLLKLSIVVFLAAWIYTYLTVNTAYYFAPTQRLSFHEYWDLRVADVAPESASAWLQKGITQEYHEYYLPQVAAMEQERLAIIRSGLIPLWKHSVIVARRWFLEQKRGLSARAYWSILGALGVMIIVFRLRQIPCYFEQKLDFVTSIFRPIGWYRFAVLALLFILSDWLGMIYLTGLVPIFLDVVYFLLAVFFSIGFAGLFYYYFLRET